MSNYNKLHVVKKKNKNKKPKNTNVARSGNVVQDVTHFHDIHIPKEIQNYIECLVDPRGASTMEGVPSTFTSQKVRIVRGWIKGTFQTGQAQFGYLAVDPERYGNDLTGFKTPVHYTDPTFTGTAIDYNVVGVIPANFTCDYASTAFDVEGGWQTVGCGIYVSCASTPLQTSGNIVFVQEDAKTALALANQNFNGLSQMKNARILSSANLINREHQIFYLPKSQGCIDWKSEISNNAFSPPRLVVAAEGNAIFHFEVYCIQSFKGRNVLGEHSPTSGIQYIGKVNSAIGDRGTAMFATSQKKNFIGGMLSHVSKSTWEEVGAWAHSALSSITSAVKNFIRG